MSAIAVSPRPRLEKAEANSAIQWFVVGAWSILPFLVVLMAPAGLQQSYFWAVVAILGTICFGSYVRSIGLTEALLIGLIFITNSALSDPDYLPRFSFMGGNFFFCDFYIVVACGLAMIASTPFGGVLAGYKNHFIAVGAAVLIATLIGLSRGADAHYVLRELHPLIYYPISVMMASRVLKNTDAAVRLFKAITNIVLISCVATIWQLALVNRFRFMTYAGSVFGLSEGEMFNAHQIRPPSQWLFLAFFLSAVASYPLWKKHRVLVCGVMALVSVCIFVGYSRTLLISVGGGLIVLGMIKKPRPLSFLWSATKGAAIIAAALALLSVTLKHAAPAYWEAFKGRIMGSLTANVVDSDQPWIVGSRYYELEMALEHIKEHPIIGLGIGTRYREILPFELTEAEVVENPDDATHFIHNAYIYVWMKWGLFGLLAVAWTIRRFLIRSWSLAKTGGGWTIAGQAVIVCFAGLAIANTVAPGFIASPAAPTLVGLMVAFVESSHAWESRSHSLARGTPRTITSVIGKSDADVGTMNLRPNT